MIMTSDYKPANFANWAFLLKHYGKAKALSHGRRVHNCIRKSGIDRNTSMGNCLVQMYGNCGSIKDAQAAFNNITKPNLFSWTALIKAYGQNGSLQEARNVFERMPCQDVVSWTAMIATLAQNGHCREALDLFHRMRSEGSKPDKFTYVCLLDVCASLAILEMGRHIHAAISNCEYEQDVVVGTALINMYGKCGYTYDARSVFIRMLHRDMVCWNAMITAFTQNGLDKMALSLFRQMQVEGIEPNGITFVCTLDACASLSAFNEGQAIHGAIAGSGYERHYAVRTALVNMYGNCGNLCNAMNIFTKMPYRDVVSWTAIIVAFYQNGHCQEALDLFHQMQSEHVEADSIIFICAVDACASLPAFEDGLEIHTAIIDSGYEQDVQLGNALVNMYIKCRSVHDAKSVFGGMHRQDTLSWNALLEVLIKNGHSEEALDLFRQVQGEGVKPDMTTFVCALDVCASLSALEEGRAIHAAVMDSDYGQDVVVGTSLLNMYGKCGRLYDARNVFESMPSQDIVAWNAMITAFVQCGHCQEAVYLFGQIQLASVKPNSVTLVSVIDACTSLADIKCGKEIHAVFVEGGHELDVMVGTALINMYSKCGSLCDAMNVFSCMPRQDVVSWTAMIAACTQNGQGKNALDILHQMCYEGIKPDKIAFVCAIDACASLAALEQGQKIHAAMIDVGLAKDAVLGTALINMYGKCGSVHNAKRTFINLSHRDIVSWNAMIAALAQNGHGKAALDLFCQMKIESIQPDSTTFVCILTACSYTGLVDDGRHLFHSMHHEHGIDWTTDHYVCMIDLLGRAGHLDEAEDFIDDMPLEEDAVALRCLLGACRIHGDIERGEQWANHCFKLDPKNDAPYVMLSNIYAVADRAEERL